MQSDIVYKIKNKNAFFLIEHQSRVDYEMLVRLMEYSIEIIRNKFDESKALNKRFPRVIPIVLYTGDHRWNVENKYSKLEDDIGYINLDSEQDELGIDLKYNLVDINKFKIEDLIKEESLVSKAMIIEKCKTREKILDYIDDILLFYKINKK